MCAHVLLVLPLSNLGFSAHDIVQYMAAMVPVRVGFDFVAYGAIFWFETLIDCYFWCDVIVNFLTAFEEGEQNRLVTDPKRIALQYLKSWCVLHCDLSLFQEHVCHVHA